MLAGSIMASSGRASTLMPEGAAGSGGGDYEPKSMKCIKNSFNVENMEIKISQLKRCGLSNEEMLCVLSQEAFTKELSLSVSNCIDSNTK